MNNQNKKLKPWEIIALQGMELAFDSKGSVLKDLSNDNKQKAIELLYRSIELKADLCWPYIKLADLIDNHKEKIKLYFKAYLIEDNIFSIKFLFKQILQDHPHILDNYLLS